MELINTLDQWSKANAVKIETIPYENVVELTWRPDTLGNCYIDVSPHPQKKNVLVVQHGTFKSDPDDREETGMSLCLEGEIREKLTQIKTAIDTGMIVVRPWDYQPRIDIGMVTGVKLR